MTHDGEEAGDQGRDFGFTMYTMPASTQRGEH